MVTWCILLSFQSELRTSSLDASSYFELFIPTTTLSNKYNTLSACPCVEWKNSTTSHQKKYKSHSKEILLTSMLSNLLSVLCTYQQSGLIHVKSVTICSQILLQGRNCLPWIIKLGRLNVWTVKLTFCGRCNVLQMPEFIPADHSIDRLKECLAINCFQYSAVCYGRNKQQWLSASMSSFFDRTIISSGTKPLHKHVKSSHY